MLRNKTTRLTTALLLRNKTTGLKQRRCSVTKQPAVLKQRRCYCSVTTALFYSAVVMLRNNGAVLQRRCFVP